MLKTVVWEVNLNCTLKLLLNSKSPTTESLSKGNIPVLFRLKIILLILCVVAQKSKTETGVINGVLGVFRKSSITLENNFECKDWHNQEYVTFV